MNNIVLFEPEIPQNTGNIMRTCVATNTVLHLIEPLGFKLTEKEIKRSGVNYIKDLVYYVYPNFDDFLSKHQNNGEFYFLTRYGLKSIYDLNASDSSKNYYFVFGKESTGVPKEILKEHLDRCIRLPMSDKVRSLNLSNTAAIVIYEALRQQGFPNLSFFEPETMKGKNYLIK
ncbi:MAG TPA: tRNA (cytidine(34)-2'-O)-methyltransferase [Acholeplasmataceae bacterium]|nr:tRNA (cytidine(34)-2'-O)-methyltransferase [Acholeplasmataceae bacterium]